MYLKLENQHVDITEEIIALAENAVILANERYHHILDFTEKTLTSFDNLLALANQSYQGSEIESASIDVTMRTVHIWGAYFGEFIHRNWRGKWDKNNEGIFLSVGGISIDPFKLVLKNIKETPRTRIQESYQIIISAINNGDVTRKPYPISRFLKLSSIGILSKPKNPHARLIIDAAGISCLGNDLSVDNWRIDFSQIISISGSAINASLMTSLDGGHKEQLMEDKVERIDSKGVSCNLAYLSKLKNRKIMNSMVYHLKIWNREAQIVLHALNNGQEREFIIKDFEENEKIINIIIDGLGWPRVLTDDLCKRFEIIYFIPPYTSDSQGPKFEFQGSNFESQGPKIVPCKACGKEVSKTAPSCPHCGETAPGIRISCPKCGSMNFASGQKGFQLKKAAVGAILIGPFGVLGGLLGRKDIEFCCLRCNNRWMPSPADLAELRS